MVVSINQRGTTCGPKSLVSMSARGWAIQHGLIVTADGGWGSATKNEARNHLSETSRELRRCLIAAPVGTLQFSSDLSDAEWTMVEPRLPQRNRLGRPPKTEMRSVVNAVLSMHCSIWCEPAASGGSCRASFRPRRWLPGGIQERKFRVRRAGLHRDPYERARSCAARSRENVPEVRRDRPSD